VLLIRDEFDGSAQIVIADAVRDTAKVFEGLQVSI